MVCPPIDHWRPHVAQARAYAEHRRGTVTFAVRTRRRAWSFRGTQTLPSASVLKAMLLVAYLDDPRVRSRHLRHSDHVLIDPMIRRSDNAAATRVLGFVGPRGVYGVASRAGMRRFTLVTGVWGLSRIDATDQARFFLHVERHVVPRHRAEALHLLASVIAPQRWGIGRLTLPGWRVYFKGGWGSGTGAVDHQVALLRGGCGRRVSVAVLSVAQGTHPYGKATLEGMFRRLLRGLPRGSG